MTYALKQYFKVETSNSPFLKNIALYTMDMV
jgi:hypothetical protein